MSENISYITCPFCGEQCIDAKPGKIRCPMCYSKFEIDDRLECMFADTDGLTLPEKGTVCAICGNIQADEVQNCLYCGMPINITPQ